MSGGDRGGGGGGGGGNGGNDCVSFTRRVALNSPDPKVVRTLKVGDVLRLELAEGAGGGRIEAHTDRDRVAGAVTFDGVSRLKACIEQGYTYIAEVLDLPGGGVCTVTIRFERY